MKKTIFAIVLTIGCYFSPYDPFNAFAKDEAGCLTCHQYPGLVRLEQPNRIKVLHIDEKKFVKSPHGKYSCRVCHTQIHSVPHTGITAVDCTTKCHLDAKNNIRSKITPFNAYHSLEQSHISRLNSESACNVCHSIYPHSKNNLVRAFLNMHTGFFLCEACHLNKDAFDSYTYDWKEPEEATFSGDPFGSYYAPKMEGNPEAGHLISRIAVFVNDKGKLKMISHTPDIQLATQFLLKEKNLSQNEKAERLKYFHRDTARKEISVACNECHSENGILDFHKLGFDANKTKILESIGIKGLVTKYKIFYLPELFGR
jgi:hypothetical protein